MCQGLTGPTHDGQDEWFLDNPAIRAFIGEVQRVLAEEPDPTHVLSLIEPAFQELLADPTWLPDHFAEPSAESGMGSGIGMWLLYRAGDGNLAFSSLRRAARRVNTGSRSPCLGPRRPLSGYAG